MIKTDKKTTISTYLHPWFLKWYSVRGWGTPSWCRVHVPPPCWRLHGTSWSPSVLASCRPSPPPWTIARGSATAFGRLLHGQQENMMSICVQGHRHNSTSLNGVDLSCREICLFASICRTNIRSTTEPFLFFCLCNRKMKRCSIIKCCRQGKVGQIKGDHDKTIRT